MMRSVSTLGRSSGAATPVSVVKGRMLARQAPDVDEAARDGGRRRHRGRHEMGARALALAALEVAVGGGGHALALARRLAVHADAHRAARLAPLEARSEEHTSELQ